MVVLWRDSWLKPLSDFDIGTEECAHCHKKLVEMEFVTSCEFCDIGIMHDACANLHVPTMHQRELRAKVNAHRDKPLHGFQ